MGLSLLRHGPPIRLFRTHISRLIAWLYPPTPYTIRGLIVESHTNVKNNVKNKEKKTKLKLKLKLIKVKVQREEQREKDKIEIEIEINKS